MTLHQTLSKLTQPCAIAIITGTVLHSASQADVIAWRGVNTADLYTHLGDPDPDPHDLSPYTNVNTNSVDGYDLWVGGVVPGVGDTADLAYDTNQSSVWSGSDYKIVIDGDFNPDHLRIRTTLWNGPNRATEAQVLLQKDLTLQTLQTTFGHTSSAQGDRNLLIESGNSLTLTGEDPFTFGGNRGGWGNIEVAGGAALRFDGVNQTFATFNHGNRVFGSGNVEFVQSNATITLGDPGMSSNANIMLDQQQLRVRSDQTWENPTGAGYINVSTHADGLLVDAIDSQPLHNLGNVAFYINRGSIGNYDYNIGEGTYQGFYIYTDLHYTRTLRTRLTGDVNLAGGAVVRASGDDPTHESDDSLIMHNNRNYNQRFYLEGNTLNAARGVRLRHTGSGSFEVRMYANDSELNIDGDLSYSSQTASGSEESPTRNIGVVGNEGTVVNLAGSFMTDVAAPNFGGLHLSTMNLVGDSDLQTYEVGDLTTLTGVQSNSYSLGTLNIGDGATTSLVMLVNDNLNSNPVTIGQIGIDPDTEEPIMGADEQESDRAGEKLIVGTLNINAGSTLIANLGVASVEVGPNTLHIDPTATLDLFTDMPLGLGDIIPNFIGLGDQTSTWAALSEFVIDSTNPGYEFAPTLNNDQNTVWQVTAIPEPASLVLVGLGGLMLLGRRQR